MNTRTIRPISKTVTSPETYLAVLVKRDRAAGKTEVDFLNQFSESMQEAALAAWEAAEEAS